MRVLVTWGSRLGGAPRIAAVIADELRARGVEVVAVPIAEAYSPTLFDAVILGGAIYADRWHRDTRQFVERHVAELARVPTWVFECAQLDRDGDEIRFPPSRRVLALVDRIGAIGHVTLNQRISARAAGWAEQIADALPFASPRPATVLTGRSPLRVLEYAIVGWAAPAALLVVMLAVAPPRFVMALHAIAMPLGFGWLSARYQRGEGARSPTYIAVAWVMITAVLDLVLVNDWVREHVSLASSIPGLWLPLLASFFTIWTAGMIAAVPVRYRR